MEQRGEGEHPSRTRRVLRYMGIAAAHAISFAPIAAFAGMSTASTEDYFGANVTTYEMTLDPWSTLDLGPFGTATAPLSYGPFAVKATVHGIPSESSLDQVGVFNSAGEQYALQYKYRDEYAQTLSELLVRDGLEKALLYEGAWLGALALGGRLMDRRIRNQVTPPKATAAALCATAAILVPGEVAHDITQPGESIASLPDVKTDSAAILFGANRVVPSLQNFLKRQERRGDEFVSNVRSQLEPVTALMQEKNDGDKVIFSYSDLHCSLVQTRIWQSVADIYQPDVVTNSGDSVTNGLRVEEPCIKNAAKIGSHQAVSDGNHDSSETQKQEEQHGMNVLKGETIIIEDISVLGDRDPERTPAFGSGAATRFSETNETEEELGKRLRKKAAEDKPDIVLMHQPKAAEAFFEDNTSVSAKFVLWGHSHRHEDPEVVWHDDGTYTIKQQLGTAGGIGEQRFDSLSTPLTTPTIDATTMAYRFNPESGLVFAQTITVSPAGELTISPWEQLVTAADILVHLPQLTPDDVFSAPQPSSSLVPKS